MALAQSPSQDSIKQLDTRYVAVARLRVGADAEGNVIYREPGEEVPEAHAWHWRALEHMLRNRHIKEVTVAYTVAPEPVKRGPGRPRKEDTK